MTGVLVQRGNLEAGTYTGRMPFEDGVMLPQAEEPPDAGRGAWNRAFPQS